MSKLHQVHAKKEVILSAGAIGTPQILQLSGIGDPTVLRRLGIPVSVDNPHVGQNMQDHPLLPNIFTAVGDTSFDHILRNATEMASAIGEWAQNRTGMISNNVVNNIGFARLNSTVLKKISDPAAGPRTPHYEMIFAVCYLLRKHQLVLISRTELLVRPSHTDPFQRQLFYHSYCSGYSYLS